MNVNTVIAFVAGAAIGSVVTMKVVENKYKKIADEEIASVVERFSKQHDAGDTTIDDTVPVEEDKPWRATKPDIMEYAAKIRDARYAVDQYDNEKEGGDEPVTSEKIYVISPEEFDELDDYEVRSFTYYEDGILVDDNGFIVESVDEIVGVGSLETFGEYEDDSVFVRNEILKTDIEILRDVREYADVHTMPRVEDE